MNKSFQYILDNYLRLGNKVDKNSAVYYELCRNLPEKIRTIVGNDKYTVKGSMGQGNKTDYPWISILDNNITTSTQRGLYIVFLFIKDMSGFYLTLNQGITNFENLYGKDKYVCARKVANSFKNQIGDETTFSKNPIYLKSNKNSLGYGYEATNILQKYYPSNNFTTEMLEDDIREIINVYTAITDHMDSKSYDDIIKGICLESDVRVDKAIEEIKKAVDPDDEMPYGFNRKLIEVEPKIKRSSKFKIITNPRVTKIDHIKKATRDARTGLLGEQLVMSYEINRLNSLGYEEYANKIDWVSEYDDSKGYDIKSYDIDESGIIREIKIEVKTTKAKVDTEFFVSKNELNTSIECSDHYYIYRIYDAGSLNPCFYRVLGKIEDHFILDPYTYTARYKGTNN